jgi:hypothetical protein
MPMEATAQDFQERYQAMCTEELIDIARTSELTDVASEAMRRELAARGVGMDEAAAHAVFSDSKPIVVAWADATKPFPRVWIGYLVTLLLFLPLVVESIQLAEIERHLTVPPIALLSIAWLGSVYWLFCVHRLHSIVAEATGGRYPIAAAQASGFHFIPFFNLYWIFKWPAAMGRLLRENGNGTLLGGWLGVPILLGFVIEKFIDFALGLLILFSIMTYVVSTVRRAAAVKPLESESRG